MNTYLYRKDKGRIESHGCCSFLNKHKEDLYIILEKDALFKDLDSNYVENWIKILNESHMSCKLVDLDDKDKQIIRNGMNSSGKLKLNNPIINRLICEIVDFTRSNIVVGSGNKGYGVGNNLTTNCELINIVNHNGLYKIIEQLLVQDDYKDRDFTIVVTNVVRSDRNDILRGKHTSIMSDFEILIDDKKINLFEFAKEYCSKFKEEYFNSLDRKDEGFPYYIVKVNKEDYLSPVHPRTINSAIRMLKYKKYKGMIVKAIELYKNGFNGWDSLYLSHLVKTSQNSYDGYHGLFAGISYYRTKSQLLRSIETNKHSTNDAFMRWNGYLEYDRNTIDKYIIENDYKSLLEYMRTISIGDDKNIGNHLMYIGDKCNNMRKDRFYEIIESTESSYLVLDDFLNERRILKSKFKSND